MFLDEHMPVETEQEEHKQCYILRSTTPVPFSYLNEDITIAELVLLLDKFGCPDYGLMEIVE